MLFNSQIQPIFIVLKRGFCGINRRQRKMHCRFDWTIYGWAPPKPARALPWTCQLLKKLDQNFLLCFP